MKLISNLLTNILVHVKFLVPNFVAYFHLLDRGGKDVERFLDYVRRNSKFRTTIERGSGEGISISCKIAD